MQYNLKAQGSLGMSVIICVQLALVVNDFPSRNTKEWPYLVCNAGDLQMGITHTHTLN